MNEVVINSGHKEPHRLESHQVLAGISHPVQEATQCLNIYYYYNVTAVLQIHLHS